MNDCYAEEPLTRLVVHVVRELRLRINVADPEAAGRPRRLPFLSRIHSRVDFLDLFPSLSLLFTAEQLHYMLVPRVLGVFHSGVVVVVLGLGDVQTGEKRAQGVTETE